MIAIIISLLFEGLPTWFEVYLDRNGDRHPNSDWKLRAFTCSLVGAVSAIILGKLTWITFLLYTFTAGCIFSGLFPYWMNYVHLKNGVTHIKNELGRIIPYGLATRKEILSHIVNHLSDKAWPDKTTTWRAIGWKARLFLCVDMILLGLVVFTVCYLNTHD